MSWCPGELGSVFKDVERLVKKAEDRNLTRTAEVGKLVGESRTSDRRSWQDSGGRGAGNAEGSPASSLPRQLSVMLRAVETSRGKEGRRSQRTLQRSDILCCGHSAHRCKYVHQPSPERPHRHCVGQDESGQSLLKLPEWSPITGPRRGSPHPQENWGREAVITETTH